MEQYIIYYWLVVVMLMVSVIKLRGRAGEVPKNLQRTLLCAISVTASYMGALYVNQYLVMSILYSVMYVSVDWMLFYLFRFTRIYVNAEEYYERIEKAGKWLILLDSIVLLENPFTEFAVTYKVYTVGKSQYLSIMSRLPYQMHLIFCYLIVAMILYLYANKIRKIARIYRRRYLMMSVIIIIVCVVNGFFVFTSSYIDFSILSYGVLAFLIMFYVDFYEPRRFQRLVTMELFEHQNAMVLIFDRDDCMMSYNKKADHLFHLRKQKQTVVLSEFLDKWKMDYLDTLEENGYFEWKIKIEDKIRYFNVNYQRIIERNKYYVGSYVVLNETTEQRELECYDRLTGIYNREFFCRETNRMLQKRKLKGYVMVAFDVQCFKVINEVMGIQCGDTVLQVLAEILYEHREPGTTFGRLLADNFIVCVKESMFDGAKIEQEMWEKCLAKGIRLENGLSFGGYRLGVEEATVEQMCDRAMLALRNGKSDYNNRITWYENDMSRKMVAERFLISEMPRALEEKQFEVLLQPQYDSFSEKINGSEALVRWNHPEKGYLSPSEFIPVFEQNGLIGQLDYYVWECACQYLAKWEREGKNKDKVSISVNISRVDLYYMDVLEALNGLVEQYKIDRKCLKLEITESAYTQEESGIRSTIRELQQAGFIVEMDDFGSGYSSLNCLKVAPVDVLKLDMRFLDEDGDKSRGKKIICGIVRMALDIGLTVIAEGVESFEQAELMRSLGTQIIQGYYYASPITLAEFEQRIQ